MQDERIIMKGVPAQHSADPDVNTDLEVVNGYMISYVEEGRSRRIYWTGDTVWFDGLSGIQADAGAIDLLIAHIGAVGDGGPWGRMTLDGSEAARLAKLFQPGTVIPIHHHTFSHYVEPVTVFEKAMDTAGTSIRTVVLSEGEEFKL